MTSGTGLVHTALGIPCSYAALLPRTPSVSTDVTWYLVVVVFPSIFWLFQIFTVPSFEHVAKSKCSSETLIRFTADLCSWRCATSNPLGRHPERRQKCILKRGWGTRSPSTLQLQLPTMKFKAIVSTNQVRGPQLGHLEGSPGLWHITD